MQRHFLKSLCGMVVVGVWGSLGAGHRVLRAGEIPVSVPVAQIEGIGGLPGEMKTAPGLAWYHHTSVSAEKGPSPRVKYRDRYHTAGTLEKGLQGIQAGDTLKTPPGLWVVLQSPLSSARLGLLESSEIILGKAAQSLKLISGSAWVSHPGGGASASDVLIEAPHLRVSRIARDSQPVEVLVQDDEHSGAQVWVRVLLGRVVVQPFSGGAPIGEKTECGADEQLQVVFPGAAQGVDDQRFFSAMEPEPEWVRTPLEPEQKQSVKRWMTAPLPVVSPSPSISEVPHG